MRDRPTPVPNPPPVIDSRTSGDRSAFGVLCAMMLAIALVVLLTRCAAAQPSLSYDQIRKACDGYQIGIVDQGHCDAYATVDECPPYQAARAECDFLLETAARREEGE